MRSKRAQSDASGRGSEFSLCSALGMVEMEVIERLFEEVRVKFRFEPRFCGVNLNETSFAHFRHSGAME